jgi:hypothetical protein
MSIFTDSDLQDFGLLAQDLAFKDTCDILRNTPVVDDQGGSSPGEYVAHNIDPIPCAVIDDQAPRPLVQAQQMVARITKTIMMPRLTDVLRTDKIKVNGTDMYIILDLLDPTTYEVVRRVVVLREEVGD